MLSIRVRFSKVVPKSRVYRVVWWIKWNSRISRDKTRIQNQRDDLIERSYPHTHSMRTPSRTLYSALESEWGAHTKIINLTPHLKRRQKISVSTTATGQISILNQSLPAHTFIIIAPNSTTIIHSNSQVSISLPLHILGKRANPLHTSSSLMEVYHKWACQSYDLSKK